MRLATLWPRSSFRKVMALITFNITWAYTAAFNQAQDVLYKQIPHLNIYEIISSLNNKSE